jgi:hypothetical protein
VVGADNRSPGDSAPRPVPPGRALTSREACLRALRVHARLFRLVADEPDLGAAIDFELGRSALRRLAAAEPWVIGPRAAAELRALIEAAERVDDPRTADTQFHGFYGRVLVPLERRLGRPPALTGGARRRAGDARPAAAPASPPGTRHA